MTYVFKYIWFGCPWPCDGLNDRQKRQLLANLENALFPQMLNFLMCTINHKSPNISIQYCLPTCLVGFHSTKSWQPNERGALIGWSSPQLSGTTNHSAAFSGVCKSRRQAQTTKSENLIERVFLFLTHRQTKDFLCKEGCRVDLRSMFDNVPNIQIYMVVAVFFR